jgi:hypothetical protein
MKHRPTYANVVATFALALTVSGGAYAAGQLPKNSVGSAQIKTQAVKSADIRNGGVKPADLAPATATALAKGLMQGTRTTAQATLAPAMTSTTLMTVPGVGPLKVRCVADADERGLSVELVNSSGALVGYVAQQLSEAPAQDSFAGSVISAGGSFTTSFAESGTNNNARYLQLAIQPGPVATVELHGITDYSGTGTCAVSVTAHTK